MLPKAVALSTLNVQIIIVDLCPLSCSGKSMVNCCCVLLYSRTAHSLLRMYLRNYFVCTAYGVVTIPIVMVINYKQEEYRPEHPPPIGCLLCHCYPSNQNHLRGSLAVLTAMLALVVTSKVVLVITDQYAVFLSDSIHLLLHRVTEEQDISNG
jgi:hypothetical protein